VLPIENSTEGSVHRTLDLLAATDLTLQRELVLPIRHQLLGKAKAYADVTDVWAHPQALAQCRAWLVQYLPNAALHAARSNGEAAQLAAGNLHAAAIAGEAAAGLYGLHVLAKDIADNPHNTTRFVCLGATQPPASGRDKTSLVCSLPNKAGSLYGLLGIFARHQVNLTKLESRPLPGKAWDYFFYIDCDGHASDKNLSAALEEVQAYALHYKLLGSYPCAEEGLA
jgi:chorismate mutase/prephenate dehydratase